MSCEKKRQELYEIVRKLADWTFLKTDFLPDDEAYKSGFRYAQKCVRALIADATFPKPDMIVPDSSLQ
jgi:hypothetical protein